MEFCANKEFANVMTRRLKQKRVLYFSFRLENNDLDAPFDISDISLEYELYKSRR